MEEMVLAAERGNGVSGGSGGVGVAVGGVGLEGARDCAPPKQLQRKSVSFTGDESYQILGSGQSDNSVSKGVASAGGGGKMASPVAVAPASTFFLRANRSTTSPMVTPHAAYATFAKKIPPHTSSVTASAVAAAAAAARAGSSHTASAVASRTAGGGGGGAPRFLDGPQTMCVPRANESATSANVTPPQRTRPPATVAATFSATTEAAAAPESIRRVWTSNGSVGGDRGGGEVGSGRGTRRDTPSPTQAATTTDGSNSENGSERGTAVGAMMAVNGGVVGLPGERGGADQPVQRHLLDDETVGGWQEEGEASRVVGGDAEEERGRSDGRQSGLKRALPSGGRGGGRAGDAREGGLAGLGGLMKTPPALYEDVIDTEVRDEEDADDDDSDELANNIGENSPYFDDDEDEDVGDGGRREAKYVEADYTPGGVHGSGSGAKSRQQNQCQRQESSSWSAVPESDGNGTDSGPRSRGKRSKWDIGDRYRFIRTLGRGSYGEVAQCEDLKEGGLVAIKRVLNVFNSEADAKRIYREMYILRHMRHDEIIHLRDVLIPAAYENFRDLYLVFEFVDTDLYKLIGSPQFLTDEHVKLFLYQMLVGLKYVHSAHVIHRDIKPANVLLNEDCTVKVCDFGLSRVVTQEPSTDPVPPPASVVKTSKSGKLACSPMKPSSGAAAATSHAAAEARQGGGTAAARGGVEGGGGCEDEPPVMPQRTLKRQLTKHVVTRWYRAPELILLQDYNNAVDMWSLGCILAELLSMQKESFATSQERNALFPGKSCFPLSAEKPSSYSDALDQLNVIFDVIGTPSREDIQDLGEVRQYLARLAYKPPLDLRHKYAGASESALDLLSRMLRFDPSRRITIDDALNHPYLASCRRPEKEVTASVPITMEFEHITTDKATLKRLIYEEVLHYHPEEAARLRLAPAAPPSDFTTAAAPNNSIAAAAAAAAATAAATKTSSLSSKRSRNDGASGDSADATKSADPRPSVAKRPAGEMIDHQEREQKRTRLATDNGRVLSREHPMPAVATGPPCSYDHLTNAAAAAATRPELATGGDSEEEDEDDQEMGASVGVGGTKRSREDRDAGNEKPSVYARSAHGAGVASSGKGGRGDGYDRPSKWPRRGGREGGVRGGVPPEEALLPCPGTE